MKDVAGQALGVHPYEHLLLARNIAEYQGDVLCLIHVVAVADDPEFAERRRETRVGHAMDQPLVFQPVGDELRDRDEGQAVLLGEPLEVRTARHRAVRIEDLADDPCGIQPGQSREIDARFGLTDTLQDTAGTRAQREDVPRAAQIAGHGLMPIIEPEVSIKSPDKAGAEAILLAELTRHLEAMPNGPQVMFKLTLPDVPDLYLPLVKHKRVTRVVALSGGYTRAEACRRLAANHGVIASFSRALVEELRHSMSDAEFEAALAKSIDEIYRASTEKV